MLIYKRAFSSESSFPTHLCQFILILLWARLYFKRNILWVLILWDSLKFAQVIFQTKQPKVLFEKMWKVQFEGARQVPPLNIDSGGGGGLGGQTHLWIILCSWWYHRLACFFIHLLCLCVWYMAIYIDVVSSARGMRLKSSCLLVQKSIICKWGKSTIWKWGNPQFANKARHSSSVLCVMPWHGGELKYIWPLVKFNKAHVDTSHLAASQHVI